jgi:putative flippase GtrA
MAHTEVLPTTGIRDETPTVAGAIAGPANDPAMSPVEGDLKAALIEIAIPVYNEQDVLESSIRRLRSYLDRSFPFTASIVIMDNASIDDTWVIAERLCDELEGVTAVHLEKKGKGRAVRAAWTLSRSEIVAYMDVDLSTDLDGLLPLVAPLLSGHSQLAIGSRIAPGSRVLRGAKREFISRSYNLILRTTLRSRFSDAQCGFKAMRRDTVGPLLQTVEDNHWFFDTELLMQAERRGYRIHEVPVDWIDDPDTRVNVGGVMWNDLRGVWRLACQRHGVEPGGTQSPARHAPTAHEDDRELARYASVGVLSTALYLTLFLVLRSAMGIFVANVIAVAATTLVNTLAHLMFTFRSKSTGRGRYAAIAATCSFLIQIGLTSAALALVYAVGATSTVWEGLVLLAGMVAASAVKFVLLREWAFRRHSRDLRTGVEQLRADFPGASVHSAA